MAVQEYDIAVVGAGLAGSSLAGALAAVSNKRVVVLERHIPQAISDPSPESRPISLSYGSQQALATLGWWDALSEYVTPIQSVEVSQMGRMGVVNFSAADFEVPALGYVVPYDYLHQQLYQATADNKQVTFLSVDGIDRIEYQGGQTQLQFQQNGDSATLQARLVIAADGTRSDCRQLLGIESESADRGSVALSGELQLTSSHQGQALQRFSELGVIAILPLADPKRVRFVLSVSAQQKEKVSSWGKRRWLRFWQRALRGRLMVESQKLTGEFPLSTQMAKEVQRPGVVLLGNAAHTIYPLAAQGFNLTWRDVAALVELLVDAMNDAPSEWASGGVLNAYAQWRDKDARQLKCFTDAMQNLFQIKIPLLDHLRGLSLMALDSLPGGKAELGRWLMGVGGKVPKLMRGVLPVQHDNQKGV